MELITDTMRDFRKEDAYVRAKHHADKLKSFYVHVVIYLVLNTCLTTFKIFRNINNGETFNEAFFDFSTLITWALWGIGLALHAFSVFGLPFLLGKNWEQKKIEKLMKEEEQNTNWN